jgi:hypothetical protein
MFPFNRSEKFPNSSFEAAIIRDKNGERFFHFLNGPEVKSRTSSGAEGGRLRKAGWKPALRSADLQSAFIVLTVVGMIFAKVFHR